jgi:hypothetical protein
MCSEAHTVLKAVMMDIFFYCRCLEIPSENHIRHIPGCTTLDWKRSRISMLEVEAIPHSCILWVHIGLSNDSSE